jgi:hypothetical protein
MTNDSIQAHRVSAVPFDQDSCDIEPERDGAGVCAECRRGRCDNCSNTECGCAHPFAAIARAIVELDGSINRTKELLGQTGGSSDRTY